jgi:hypothetical protein
MSLDSTVWAAVIAAAAALAGGALGGAFSAKITSRQVTSAEDIAKRQRSHELQMAREERDQTRKDEACIAVLTFVQQTFVWAEWMEQKATYRPELLGPEPSIKVSRNANAVARLYLSTESRKVLEEFNKAANEAARASVVRRQKQSKLDKTKEDPNTPQKTIDDLQNSLDKFIPEFHDKYKELNAIYQRVGEVLEREIIIQHQGGSLTVTNGQPASQAGRRGRTDGTDSQG